MKNKKQTLFAIIIFMMAIAMSGPGCKEFGIPDYTVTITVDENITGTPAAGQYTHKALTEIEFEYNHSEDEQIPISIRLNERLGNHEGSFIVYNNLAVHAQIFDIRSGSWKFTMTNSEGIENEFTITFAGDNYNTGTFTDSRSGDGGAGHGTWEIQNYRILLTYENWDEYILISGEDTYIPALSGSWKNGEEDAGTWTAEPEA